MEEAMKTEISVESGKLAEGPKRRRQSDAASDTSVIRVRLPEPIGTRVREKVAELKARGASITADELLAEYLSEIPERYLDEQLQRRTPEPYYLEAAMKIPDLREMLIRHAKKGLVHGPSAREPGKRRRGRPKSDVAQGSAIAE